MKRSTFGWAILILVFSLSGCDLVDVSDRQHVARAKDFYDDGDLRASSVELKNALQKNPGNPEARWLLGRLHVELESGPAAAKELYRALELGIPRDVLVVDLATAKFLQRKYDKVLELASETDGLDASSQARLAALEGEARLMKRELDKADAAFQRSIELAPEGAHGYMGMARLALRQGRNDDARTQLDQTLQKSPNLAAAWVFLGDLERMAGDAEAAEAAYSKSISLHLNHSVDRLKRAITRIVLGRYDEAKRDLSKLPKSYKDSPGVQYAKGLANYQQGRLEEGKAALQAAVNANANYRPALFYLGATHFRLKEYGQAELYLGRYVNLSPWSRRGRMLLALLYIQEQKFPRAEEALRPFLERYPDDVEVMGLMSDVLLAQGDGLGSGMLSSEILRRHGNVSLAHTKLGLAYLMEGDEDKGFSTLRSATDSDNQGDSLFTRSEFALISSYLTGGRPKMALAGARKMLERNPQNRLALNVVGIALQRMGKEDEAIQALRGALEIIPGDVSASENLARIELARGNRKAAEQLYLQSLEYHPKQQQTLLNLASLALADDELDEAHSWLDKALAYKPDAVPPRVLKAQVYLKAGQPEATLDVLREITGEERNTPELLRARASAQAQIGEYDVALSTYEKLAEVDSDSADIRFLLAGAYYQVGKPERVRRALEAALNIDPKHAPTLLELVKISLRDKDLDKAQTYLDRLKQDHPDHPVLLAHEGWLSSARGNQADAVLAAEQAYALVPTQQLAINLAAARWSAGDREGSLSMLAEWLEDNPEDVLVRYNFALRAMQVGRVDEAANAFATIIHQVPDHVVALNNLAWLLRIDKPEKAEAYATQAVELAPKNAGVLNTLGNILRLREKYSEAQRWLQRAIDLSDEPGLRLDLAEMFEAQGEHRRARVLAQQLVEEHPELAQRDKVRKLLAR